MLPDRRRSDGREEVSPYARCEDCPSSFDAEESLRAHMEETFQLSGVSHRVAWMVDVHEPCCPEPLKEEK